MKEMILTLSNKFHVRGDVVEIFPSNNGENAIRVEFFGDEMNVFAK